MDVNKAYKRTDIGVIPTDWLPTTIGRLAVKIGSGKTPAGGSARYRMYGRPFVRSQNVGWGTLLLDDLAFIDDDTHKEFLATEVKHGDVLLNITGASIGRSAMVDARLMGGNVNQHVCIIRASLDQADPRFINYILLSKIGQSQIDSFQAGGNREGLNFGQVQSIQIALPPKKAEQEAIAEALSDTDALIESLQQLIAKKRQIKQGAMQTLLTGRDRLPGFTRGWKTKPIGQFTDCAAGGTPSTKVPSYWGGTIRWMSSGELNLKVVADVEGRITEEGLRNSSTKIVPANCVLVGLAGQGKTRGTVARNLVPLCTNQSIAAIFPASTYVVQYLYHNLDFRYEELRDLSAGDGGRGGLNLTIIRQIPIPFPSLEEQAAISAVLSDMDVEIAVLEARLTKTREIKQGMMQALLTGHVRLPLSTAA